MCFRRRWQTFALPHGRSLTPARHVAETLQRHQRDAEAARGRPAEDAGAEAVIDSAHQDDQGDDPPGPEPDAGQEAANGEPERDEAEGKPDSGVEQHPPAEVPAGLARIRTAAANATSALLGGVMSRAVGGAKGAASADAGNTVEHDGSAEKENRDGPPAGALTCSCTRWQL